MSDERNGVGPGLRRLGGAVLIAAIACGPSIDILDVMEKSRSADPEVALRARENLDRYVVERRVPLFQRALESDRVEDRGLALWSLGRIGTPEALRVLAGQLAPEKAFPLSFDLRLGYPTLQAVDSRLRIARMVRQIGPPPEGVERVSPALRSPDPGERLIGVQVLGLLRDPAATPLLVPLLGDPDRRVEKAAAEALGGLRDPAAIGPLLERAVDPEARSRRTALTALQRFHDPAIVAPLLDSLRTEGDLGVRFQLVSLLGKYPERRVVEALIPALASADQNLRRMAEQRLCELTHRRPGLPADDWARWWREVGDGYEFPP